MAKKDKKQKKKFELDYLSSLVLASFLLAIAYDCFQKDNGQRLTTANIIFGLIAAFLSLFIIFRAIKKIIVARKAQLLAEYERRQKELEDAESEAECDNELKESDNFSDKSEDISQDSEDKK